MEYVGLKYYFIVATPRSGTTFISRAMDHAHRTKSVVGDLILPVTCSLHALSRRRRDQAFSDAIEHGFESEIVRRSQINSRFEAIHRLLIKRQGVKNTLKSLRRIEGFERFVFKEPFLSFSPSMATNRIASGIFWIIRDGRDVANSLVETYNILTDADLRTCQSNENPVKTDRKVGDLYIPWWVNDEDVDVFVRSPPYVRAGIMWAFTVKSCRSTLEGNEIVMKQRYEDLVSDSERCRTALQDFLDVPKTSQLRKACRTASNRSVGAFKCRDRSEVNELENVIGPTLAQFGYTS